MEGLIDTHFHLDHYINHQQLYQQISSLKQYTICVTNSPGVYISCKKMYLENKYIKFALGFHPQETQLTDEDMLGFKKLFKTSNYIGEVGLDLSNPYINTKSRQLTFFNEIIKMCSMHNKLVTVHLRKAETEAISILSKYNPQKCIIHWYTGNEMLLKEFINLGCYFSINTNMLRSSSFKNYKAIIPKDKILIESDGPYTKVNTVKYTPELLLYAYNEIARALDMPDLINQVYNNFRSLLLV